MIEKKEEVSSSRSLWGGFEGYRTPSDEDYGRVFTQGLVVPDTNVLLNLYRYDLKARANFSETLAALGDRLWFAHQVIREFWAKRESVISESKNYSPSVALQLDQEAQTSTTTIRT